MFLDSFGRLIVGVVFTGLLLLAAHGDLTTRRIPNRLVLVMLVLGLVASATVLHEPVGIRGALAGVGAGLALWLPAWLFGKLGAGDVKLAAACGAWLGVRGVLDASLLAMVAGGLLALAILAQRRALVQTVTTGALWVQAIRHDTIRSLAAPERATGVHGTRLLPYGVALAIGAAGAGWLPALWLPLGAR